MGTPKSDDDPLLTYLGEFEPKTTPLTPEQGSKLKKNILHSPEIEDKMPKKLSLPREQRSSPPDFLYPQHVHKDKGSGDRHAFASAFTHNTNPKQPHYPYPPPNGRPSIDPYAQSNPVHIKKNQLSLPPMNGHNAESPTSPETPDANNRTLRPLMDSYSYNVFSRGNDDQRKTEKGSKSKLKQKGKSKLKKDNDAGLNKGGKKKNNK